MMTTTKYARSAYSLSLGIAAIFFGLNATATQASHQMASTEIGKKGALSVGAAFAPNGDLWLLQQDEQARLTLEVSSDEGKNWQAPRILDTGGDSIKISGEANPKILFGPNGVVIISYAQAFAKKFTGEIRLLRSTDGGANFAPPLTLHQDRQVISHSYAAMAFDANGALHSVWIDGRDKAAALAAPTDQSDKAKTAYRGVSLYRNISIDGGATFGPDTKLADYSCECCRIALTPTTAGGVAALWRQVLEPNIRDHAFALLPESNEPVTPVRASYDNWAIDGCPHHGPAISMAASGGYHVVWFGQRAGVAQVRYGKLDQAGHPIGAVHTLPDSAAEHADILSSGKKLVIVWRSYDGTAMNMKAWISDDDGKHFLLKELARSKGDSDYPRLLSKNGKIFVIWNTNEKRYVEAL